MRIPAYIELGSVEPDILVLRALLTTLSDDPSRSNHLLRMDYRNQVISSFPGMRHPASNSPSSEAAAIQPGACFGLLLMTESNNCLARLISLNSRLLIVSSYFISSSERQNSPDLSITLQHLTIQSRHIPPRIHRRAQPTGRSILGRLIQL